MRLRVHALCILYEEHDGIRLTGEVRTHSEGKGCDASSEQPRGQDAEQRLMQKVVRLRCGAK